MDVEPRDSTDGGDGHAQLGMTDGYGRCVSAPPVERMANCSSVCSSTSGAPISMGKRVSLWLPPWRDEKMARELNRRSSYASMRLGQMVWNTDGTPFYWMGDTLGPHIHASLRRGETLPADDRKKKASNVIQLVVGHPTADRFDEGDESSCNQLRKTQIFP